MHGPINVKYEITITIFCSIAYIPQIQAGLVLSQDYLPEKHRAN
jgi:hypothetical protein